MNKLNLQLLSSDELSESDLESALNGKKARGSYNAIQSVIRLHDDVHKALAKDDMSSDRILAFSTYMHETIHWWQHVGSHLGFITSISHPALAHVAHRHLNTLVKRNEKFKSIIEYDNYIYSQTGNPNNLEVNRILNYYHDIRYAKAFISDNTNIEIISKDKRFFLHMGRCFHELWSTSIYVLSVSIDPEFNFLPKIKDWSEKFRQAEKQQAPGFVTDSGMTISELGTTAIYEGQARFNQLQYLSIATGDKYSYDDFAEMGMLEGIYVEAFNLFLKYIGIDRPDNLNNSVIGLFLLVCDIAINPVEGFPSDIMDYESFIICSDPGIRFTLLCSFISKDKDKWTTAVQDYSRQEYIDLSEQLCEYIVCLPPLVGSAIVADWAEEHTSIRDLLKEESEMKFKPENLSIRLFTAKYIRFQEDKIKYPNVFCWIGRSMTGKVHKDLDLSVVEKIFNRHQALFIDVIGGEIRPTIFDDHHEENTMETFQTFYAFNTTYDMTFKWITEKGPFKYDYHWLTTKYSDQEMKDWVRNHFKATYSIFPEELKTFDGK
ncbi:hypothetical protein AB670_03749 [Chryseobacterium sp. MOF25P]|nr:hypothetical protein AB670_03749 [Chryseobacterium sp. MOF25P]OBW43641.1 hypothetical protein AB671_04282 [Chryseobacterium sp. BGARF1]